MRDLNDAREVLTVETRRRFDLDYVPPSIGPVPIGVVLSPQYQALNNAVLDWQNEERKTRTALGALLRRARYDDWPALDGEHLELVLSGLRLLEPGINRVRQRLRWARLNLEMAHEAKREFVTKWREEHNL